MLEDLSPKNFSNFDQDKKLISQGNLDSSVNRPQDKTDKEKWLDRS